MLHHGPLRKFLHGDLLLLFVAVIFSRLSAAEPPAYYYPDSSIYTNGIVHVVFFYDNRLYAGGDFTKVYDAAGSHSRTDLAVWDMSSGLITGFTANTDRGTVRSIISGNGSIFVGGSFTSINNVKRSKVAELDPVTGAVDPAFRTADGTLDGSVWALAAAGTKLFAGGSFTTIDGCVRSGLAAMDVRTGVLDAGFDPAPGDWFEDSGKTAAGVFTLELDPLDSGIVFAGGSFQTICGDESTPFLVALKPDGSRGPGFSPAVTSPIRALDARGHLLCTALGGYGNRVVAYAIDSGQYQRVWKSERAQGDVQAVAYAPQGYVFYSFHQGLYDTTDSFRLAMLNANSGEIVDAYPPMNSFFGIWTLDFADSVLAAGGEFTTMNGLPQQHLAVFRKSPFRIDLHVPPLPPDLQSPRNAQKGLTNKLEFSWSPVARARSFDLQLFAENSDSAVTLHGLTGGSVIHAGLLSATRYRWRMRSIGEDGFAGAWSEERSFITAPGETDIPVIVAPGSGTVNQPLAMNLQWRPAKSAGSYSLQLLDTSIPASKIIDFDGLIDTAFSVTGLKNDVAYIWRVRAETAGGSSDWADATFRTVVGAPGTPAGMQPSDNAVRVACQPALQWKTVDATVTYRVQVACDTGFSATVFDSAGLNDTTIITPLLDEDAHYFWRINAANPGGAVWSSRMCFSTTYPRPGTPGQVAPAAGAITAAGVVHFVWNRSNPHVSGYRLEIAHDSAMLGFFVDTIIADTEFVQLGVESGAIFWWRVSAGNESGWSPASAKRRINTAPASGHIAAFKLHRFIFTGPYPLLVYDIAQRCDVRLELFDLKGQSVWTGTRSDVVPGSYKETIAASKLTSGRYFLLFRAGEYEKKVAATLVR